MGPFFHTCSALPLLLSLLDTLDIWQKRRANNKIIGRDGLLSGNWLVAGSVDSAVVVVGRRKHNEVKNMMGCPCKAFPCIDVLWLCICVPSFLFPFSFGLCCCFCFLLFIVIYSWTLDLIFKWFPRQKKLKSTRAGQLNVSNLFASRPTDRPTDPLVESNPKPCSPGMRNRSRTPA